MEDVLVTKEDLWQQRLQARIVANHSNEGDTTSYLPRDTSCTISVFLARLRARCLHTASPRFWSQCSLQEVSSRLIRSTALFTGCSSAKFQSCHAASACQGTLHHRLINMVWQDVTTYFGGNPMFSVELRAGRWGFKPLAHKPPNAGSIQKRMLGLLNCRARKDD